MKFFKSKIIFVAIFLSILLFCTTNIYASDYTLDVCDEIGVRIADSDNFYGSSGYGGFVRVYNMEDDKGNTLYCLEPGKAASKISGNNLYNVEKSGYSGISKVCSGTITLKVVEAGNQEKTLTVTKQGLLFHILSEIYNYGSNEGANMVLKQLMIWKYMQNISTNSEITAFWNLFNFTQTEKNKIVKDVEKLTGVNLKTTFEEIINGPMKTVGNYYNGKLSFGGYTEIAEAVYGETVWSDNVNFYIPVDANGNRKTSYQILIGPPTEEPTVTNYTYTITYICLGPTGYEENRAVESNNYTGTFSRTFDNTYSANSNTYNFSYYKKNNGLASYNRNISFTNENVNIVVYYTRAFNPASINVKHMYTNSSGVTSTQINTYTPNNISCEIPFYSGYASWYVSYKVNVNSGSITNKYITTNNTIKFEFTEGANFTVEIYYKSRKVVVNYISIDETGTTNKKNNVNEPTEIKVGSSYSFSVDSMYDGKNYIGCVKPDGSSVNWLTTSFTDSNSECKQYVYTVYYENRNLHKYVTEYINNGKTFSDRLGNTLYSKMGVTVSLEESKTVDFDYSAKITNTFPYTLYGRTDKKYIFKQVYSFGNSTTGKNSDGTYINRKSAAQKNARNAFHGTGKSDRCSYIYDVAHRTIKSLSTTSGLVHADTSVIYFYYEEQEPVNVYVRHIIKNSNGEHVVSTSDTASFLKNDNETYYDSTEVSYYNDNKATIKDLKLNNGGWKTINNGYSQRRFHANNGYALLDIPTDYSEYFVIDTADKLILDKSRTLLYDGVQYVYKGYRTGSSAIEIGDNALTKKNNITIKNKAAGTSVYVDFYYEEADYSNDGTVDPTPDPNPQPDPNNGYDTKYNNLRNKAQAVLKFEGQNENDQSLGADTEDMAYVPASEYIKPYFKTASYVPYTLVYSLTGVAPSGKPTYGFKKYDVYQLVNSTVLNHNAESVVNNSTSNGENMLGTAVTNVINTNQESLSLAGRMKSIVPAIAQQSNYAASKLGLSPTEIDVGSSTTINNYEGNNSVNADKYNGVRLGNGTVTYNLVNALSNASYGKTVTVSTVKNMDVNVYTPMAIEKSTIVSTGNMVNHSESESNSNVIQKGVEFTITPKIASTQKCGYNNNLPEISKYLQGYYVIFEFDVIMNGSEIAAKTPIWVDKGSSITATPKQNEGESSVNQLKEKITTVAVTINTSEDLKSKFKENVSTFLEDSYLVATTNTTKMIDFTSKLNKYEDYGINMYADSHYFVKNEMDTVVLARLYDFKITDCYDVDFKNVFRKTTSSTNAVNDLTGICYYSGKNKLLITDLLDIIYTRSENTILPLGPYKHTQYDYVKAPKLGYRISFDVKTYGYYTPSDDPNSKTRTIKITPSYYYISKDGSTFKDNIKLYYKNSSGKYVTFNQSNYNISFKPNDGYRHLSNESITNSTEYLSDKLVNINVGESFTLDSKTMMTTDNTNFIQAWYGEFKVPNSTIVIEEGGNLNNPLTDGYLGVKFKIECIDTENTEGTGKTVTILYDINDKTKGNAPNTSQWDYEGYMGVTAGEEYSTSLQLEKGTWDITEDRYKAIKGTVVLYDLDERASNDFD